MKLSTHISLLVPLVLCLGSALAPAQPGPVAETPPVPWWERVKKPLAPEVEKALAEVAAKVVPNRKKDLEEHMKTLVALLVKTFELQDAATVKTLESAAAQAVEASMKPYPERLTETHRFRLPGTEPTQAVAAISRWDIGVLGWSRQVLGCVLPDEQAVWKQALKSALQPGQLVEWEKKMTEEKTAREKQIMQSIEPWLEAGRMQGVAVMTTRIETMAPVMKLDEARVARLKEAAAKAVEQLCMQEKDKALESMRFVVPFRLPQFLQTNPVFRAYVLDANPEHHATWREALQSITSEDERKRWEVHLTESEARFEKEIPAIIKLSLDRMRVTWDQSLDKEADQMVLALRLAKERLAGLKDVRKKVLDRAEKRWVETMTRQLRDMDAAAREAILKRGRGYYVSLPSDQEPKNDPEWKKALESLVTPEERKAMEAANALRKTRREDQVTALLVAEMDRHVALTSAQREALMPLLKKAVLGDSRFFPEQVVEYGYDYNLQHIATVAGKVDQVEIKKVLDENQVRTWQRFVSSPPVRGNSSKPAPQAAAPPGGRRPEPEDLERIISDFLHEKSALRRNRFLEVMTTAAEDAARVSGLTPEQMARLRTAARGAAESVMEDWRNSIESTVRSRLQGATVQDVRQKLASVDDYYFTVYQNRKPQEASLWQNAVKRELKPDQLKNWEAAQADRRDFLDRAVAGFILAEFDRKVQLSPEQSGTLNERLLKILKDYQTDISNYFSSSDGTPWYFQYYSMLLPLAGVPEKELKTLVTPGQWEVWSKSNEYSNCMSYWNGIEQNRNFRLKQNR